MPKGAKFFTLFDRLGIAAGTLVSVITALGLVWGFSTAWGGKADKKDTEVVAKDVMIIKEQTAQNTKAITEVKSEFGTKINAMDAKLDRHAEGLYRIEGAIGSLPPGMTISKYKQAK